MNIFKKELKINVEIVRWIMLIFILLFASVFIYSQSLATSSCYDSQTSISDFSQITFQKVQGKVKPIKVKGLYLTAYSAGSSKKINEIINLVKNTELNAVVIDVKDYSGYVLYDSNLDFVNQNNLEDIRIRDLSALIKKLKDNNIYTIARISVFQDPILAETMPEWSIKSKRALGFGTTSGLDLLWRDKNNLAWVDANNTEVWKYTLDIAQEVSSAGFDEINFDYIRFPTDGNMSDIQYTYGDKKRYQVVGEFFEYLEQRMKNTNSYISADLFGLTTEKGGEDDMMIGQRLEDAVKYFDYVCPMVYPSHYPSGYLNFDNPAEHPYEVVYNAMLSGVKKAEGQKGRLRTWIQYFNIGAVYDSDMVRAQIDASDDAGADGWILWNARNVYDGRGLR